MKRRRENLIWEGKPGLISFVVGRSLPFVMGTVIYLGPPLLGVFGQEISPAPGPWESVLNWAAMIGLVGPFFFFLVDWIFTRYELTHQTFLIRRAFGHRAIARSQILRVETDREILDGLYPQHFGSLFLTLREQANLPATETQSGLRISAIREAQGAQAIFQATSEDRSEGWCFGGTKTNLIRLASLPR